MVGKAKEACNKFIVNKFPKSVINYRNVADYVVKSNMKRNSTWGTLGRRRPAGATGAPVEMINQNRGGKAPPDPPS